MLQNIRVTAFITVFSVIRGKRTGWGGGGGLGGGGRRGGGGGGGGVKVGGDYCSTQIKVN